MSGGRRWLEGAARRVGGARVLALPLLRSLAVLAGFVWVLAPSAYHDGWHLVHVATTGFLVYSVAVIAALWRWPSALLRLNFYILLVDLTFALVLIHATGGARSTLFLALLLIAALQAYYYGMTAGRGRTRRPQPISSSSGPPSRRSTGPIS
jgi:hypothetical protein